MIPIRLTLRNFICYGEDAPTLDLESVHVACLSGQNGHGKSALLDAITWAVWGRARARTQELVHQGKGAMSVELEFDARGQRYRIVRRHSRPAAGRQGPGTTLLDLQASSGNGFRAITGGTVRETEALIRGVVHMDYDTFVNTAFLLQGRADMFTRSKPSERKECLAEVLDLSYYEDLEERAKAQGNLIQDSLKDADAEIAQLRRGLEARSEHEAALEDARASIERLAPAVEAARIRRDAQRSKVDLLRKMGQERDGLQARIAAGRSEMDVLDRQKRNHERRAADYQALMERRAEIREGFDGLEQARKKSDRLADAYGRLMNLQNQMAPLDREVAVQRERLSSLLSQLDGNIEGLESKAALMAQIDQQRVVLAEEEETLEAARKALAKKTGDALDLLARLGSLEDANTALKQKMEETRQKFDILQQEDAECPVCRQPLGPGDRGHVRAEYERQGKEAGRRYRDNASEQDRLRETHSRLAAEVSRLDASLSKQERDVSQNQAVLERDRRDSVTAQQQLDPARAERKEVQARLDGEAFAEAERTKLSELDARIAELEYDPDAHDAARRRVRELGPYEDADRRLREAEERLPQVQQDLNGVADILERRRADAAADEERIAHLSRSIVSLPSMEADLRAMEKALTAEEKALQEARVRQGVSIEELARLDRMEADAKEREKKRAALVDQKGIYDELAVAFGKNGVQALIIEAAIPQLENDANQLLSRLTDNRMALRLQLQQGRRERRLGLPSEELDIRVGDEMGTRSYETFSGGEAFRIDFSLRIALSKLLASRSGAPLPILFIDEGFGSQDSTGQERLKEAIQSIQDDFRKIIVITHVDEIKESFPTRVEVTKTPTGSTFALA